MSYLRVPNTGTPIVRKQVKFQRIQWLNYFYSARGGRSLQARGLEGPKLESEVPTAEVGFLTADQRFSSIQCTLFGFHDI